MLSEQENQEYKEWGVAPPEHHPHVTEEVRDKFFETNVHAHQFKQQGIDVHCTEGDHRHGISLHPDRMLAGMTDDGHPIFRPVVICTNPLDPTRGITVDKKHKSKS